MVPVTEASGWTGGLDDGCAAEDGLLDMLLMGDSPVEVADVRGKAEKKKTAWPLDFRFLDEEKKKLPFRKILLLEKQLDAKQRLELEIEQLKGKVEVMKHIKGTKDIGVKKLSDELKEKIEDLEDMEQLNQDLIVKEQKSHDEFQEAHNELITGLKELNGQSNIGVGRMGELDVNMFRNMCMKRFAKEEIDNKVVELCSNWQCELEKPDWHPFKLVQDQKRSEEMEDWRVKNPPIKPWYTEKTRWWYSMVAAMRPPASVMAAAAMSDGGDTERERDYLAIEVAATVMVVSDGGSDEASGVGDGSGDGV
ncbi:hypothetical protein Taro_044967 [Colocasia esculenta]|uniref:Factor of DNA methylation 1-5/IDN2 domain-containing protein n=1 Tax=Colocasia esculenta TaxID=4460 RepID=A0A843X423_COLES|nr:hypothetical protein [Colocasia esculenta]